MTTLKAVVKAGRVSLEAPRDWPDGTEVEIRAVSPKESDSGTLSPEEINRALAAMDRVESFELNNADQVAWDAEQKERKEREKADFVHHAEKLRKEWD